LKLCNALRLELMLTVIPMDNTVVLFLILKQEFANGTECCASHAVKYLTVFTLEFRQMECHNIATSLIYMEPKSN